MRIVLPTLCWRTSWRATQGGGAGCRRRSRGNPRNKTCVSAAGTTVIAQELPVEPRLQQQRQQVAHLSNHRAPTRSFRE